MRYPCSIRLLLAVGSINSEQSEGLAIVNKYRR